MKNFSVAAATLEHKIYRAQAQNSQLNQSHEINVDMSANNKFRRKRNKAETKGDHKLAPLRLRLV